RLAPVAPAASCASRVRPRGPGNLGPPGDPRVERADPVTEPLWTHHRVVVCVGTGGVGKTTVSAAMALAAAAAGKRTLVMTIDPARRLAMALGLQGVNSNDPHP